MQKPPNQNNFLQQFMMQRMLQQQQLGAATSDFNQQRQSSQAGAQSAIASEQTDLANQKRRAIARPVKLGTLLTSPQGLLGNPMLSGTQLGG